jgi:hypothetical protein
LKTLADEFLDITGYIMTKNMLAGRQEKIHAERDQSWSRRGSSGRFFASKPLDVLAAPTTAMKVEDTSVYCALSRPSGVRLFQARC